MTTMHGVKNSKPLASFGASVHDNQRRCQQCRRHARISLRPGCPFRHALPMACRGRNFWEWEKAGQGRADASYRSYRVDRERAWRSGKKKRESIDSKRRGEFFPFPPCPAESRFRVGESCFRCSSSTAAVFCSFWAT